ncbi:hypothetical protein ACLOJK_018060 [Asimina triloba]
MALAWTTHLDAYPSFAVLEQTGDSEDDTVDRRILIHDAALDVPLLREEDGDDAESCSCDSWDAICAAESVSGDVGESENALGDDSGWAYWAAAMSEEPSSAMEEEEEDGGVVSGISRNAIEAMEDKEFWETCLAVGY